MSGFDLRAGHLLRGGLNRKTPKRMADRGLWGDWHNVPQAKV